MIQEEVVYQEAKKEIKALQLDSKEIFETPKSSRLKKFLEKVS